MFWQRIVATLSLLATAAVAQKVAPKKYHCDGTTCKLMNQFVDVLDGMAQSTCLMTCGMGNIWPAPNGYLSIDASTKKIKKIFFDVASKGNVDSRFDELIDLSIANFLESLNALRTSIERASSPDKLPDTVVVSFQIADTTIHTVTLENDESYSLQISSSHDDGIVVQIQAQSFFGARHGLETLSQLIVYDDINKSTVIASKVAIENDAPRFPYRGIMLDLSRNYLPLSIIRKTIKALGYNKMNVLHLHLADTASFPVVLERQPNVTYYGAYGEDETYTLMNLKELETMAAAHGVMILPEVDGPAHVSAGFQWGGAAGVGDLTVCADPDAVDVEQWNQDSLEPPSGQLNLANPYIYTILKDVYADLSKAFPETSYFHVGGDEVLVGSDDAWAACYNSSILGKPILDLLVARGLSRQDQESFYLLWEEFTTSVAGLVAEAFSTDPTGSGVAVTAVVEKTADIQAEAMLKFKNLIENLRKIAIHRQNPAGTTDVKNSRTLAGVDVNATAKVTEIASVDSSTTRIKKLHIWGGGGTDDSGVTYNLMTRPALTSILPPELFTIQVWDESRGSIVPELIRKGYSVVLSNTDYVYLDCGNSGFSSPGGYWCQPYHEWQHIYQYIDDVTKRWRLSEADLSKVLGSETLIWGEMVDSRNLEQKLWPRSAALAEALWYRPPVVAKTAPEGEIVGSRTGAEDAGLTGSEQLQQQQQQQQHQPLIPTTLQRRNGKRSNGKSESGQQQQQQQQQLQHEQQLLSTQKRAVREQEPRRETGGALNSDRWYEADPRMQQWRYTLVNRGVNAEGLQPQWCQQRGAYACTVNEGTPQ